MLVISFVVLDKKCMNFASNNGQKPTTKNLYAPFLRKDSTVSKLQSYYEGKLLLTTKSPRIPGTHLIDFKEMKGRVDLGATLIGIRILS